MFKTSRGLLFSLLSYFYNTKKVCLKKQGGCCLVHESKLIQLLLWFGNMCVENQTGGCVFFYSATFVIRKHVCSNQAGGCFLDHSATFIIGKYLCSNQAGGCFFSLLIINKYYTSKILLLRIFIKNFVKDTF